MKNSTKKYKNKIIINILLLIFIFLFIFSLIKIVYWYIDNQKSNRILKEINNKIIINKSPNEYSITFNKLKEINPDVIAFIKVNGTNIEYPLVKYKDNNYYLNHSFDGNINSAGWPFINYLNKLDNSDKNITIFAHARRDGSMFGTLYKTLSSEWSNNKNNLKILFITETQTNYYQVFSTYKILEENYYIKNNFNNDNEYINFLNKLKNRSIYDYSVNLDKNDTILTLSTCSSDDRYRIVLHAKKII